MDKSNTLGLLHRYSCITNSGIEIQPAMQLQDVNCFIGISRRSLREDAVINTFHGKVWRTG